MRIIVMLSFVLMAGFMSPCHAQVSIEKLNEGVDLFNRQQYEKAIDIFSKAIRENESVPGKVYFYRAYSYSQTGEYKKAIRDYDRYLQDAPGDYKSFFYKGACYYELSNYPEAEKSFLKAIELEPNYVKAIWQLGASYEQMQNNEKALQAFNKALAIDSLNVAYYFKRANFYIYKMGNDEKASRDLFKILQLDSSYKSETVLSQFINILVKQKYYAEANKFSNIMIKRHSNNPLGYYYRGITSLFLGNEGCQDLKTAWEKGYEDAQVLIEQYCE